MSSQITTPVGVPAELNWTLPSSMVPSRKYELRTQPYGASNFNPGNTIRIVLPQMQRTVLNTQTGYLLGSVNFTGAATVDSFILGSMYSLFSRQVIRAGSGYVLETIDQPGLLVNSLLNMTLNPSERTSLSNTFGFNATNGILNIGPAVLGASVTVPFAIPLVGLLNLSKMLPSWNGDIEIELTLAQISDFMALNGVAPVTLPTNYTVSNVEYVVEALELSPEAYSLIMAQNPQQVVLKTQSYSFGGSTLEQNATGTKDIPFQIKVNSLKQLIWYASPSDIIDGRYGGINPNLDSYQFIVNGQSYPQRPVQCRNRCEAFMQNQKAFGSVYSNNHSGSAGINQFAIASTAAYATANGYNVYDNAMAANDLTTKAHKWYQCLDMEIINSAKDTLYNGVTTNGVSSTLRLNINSALSGAVHNIYYWSCHDVLIVMDMVGGITSVIQ